MAFVNSKASGITTETVVYTATGVTGTVIGMTIAPTGVDATVSITLDDGVTPVKIVKDLIIAAGTSAIPVGGGQKLVVANTETIKVVSSAAVDVIVSVLEA